MMKCQLVAVIRGSNPPSGHTVHQTGGGTWQAPAMRLMQKHIGVAV